MENYQSVFIVGGGFGGIKTALELLKNKQSDTKIKLISNKMHFEYHATLYRVLTGRSPLQVCIPLEDIFNGKDIEIIEDSITDVDPKEKMIKGKSGSIYHYYKLVLSLGSQPNFYNTPGLE